MALPVSEVVWPLRRGGAVSCAEPPSRSPALQRGHLGSHCSHGGITERVQVVPVSRAFPSVGRAALTPVLALSEFRSPGGPSGARTPPGPVMLGRPLPRPGQLEGVGRVRKGT